MYDERGELLEKFLPSQELRTLIYKNGRRTGADHKESKDKQDAGGNYCTCKCS